MNKDKFHLESPVISDRNRFSDRVIDICDIEDERTANFLLRLYLNGAVCQNDIEQLSLPDDLFVIHNRKFIYPDEENIFEIDTIESSLNQCGEAVCTHYLDRIGNSRSLKTKIITAPLQIHDNFTVVIGCALDISDSTARELEFNRLIDKLKQGIIKTRPVFDNLKKFINNPIPSIIVEHPDNSILTINRSMSNLLGNDKTEYIGKNFELTDFPDLLKFDGNLKFTKLKSDRRISIIQYVNDNPVTSEEDNLIYQRIKSGTGNIILSVTHLNQISPSDDDSEIYCRSVILNEAVRVNNLVNLHNLIQRLKNTEKVDLNPLKLLKQITGKYRNAHDTAIKVNDKDYLFSIHGKYEAYSRLFEMIIDIYTEIGNNSQITIDCELNDEKLSICFDTKYSENLNDFQLSELSNIKYLCDMTGIAVSNETDSKSNFTTILTIEKE